MYKSTSKRRNYHDFSKIQKFAQILFTWKILKKCSKITIKKIYVACNKAQSCRDNIRMSSNAFKSKN